MKRTIRAAALLLAVILLVGLPVSVLASDSDDAAETLNALGLFQGTGNGYELDREPTRAEALVMLIRLLGREEEALAYAGTCPLTDVAGRWMAPYVGWAYECGITKGVSDTSFDPDSAASGKMYAAFVLRALGYREEAGDFAYNDAVSAAAELGLAPAAGYRFRFVRGDAVLMSCLALGAGCKDSEQLLLEKLVEEGAVSPEAAEKTGILPPVWPEDAVTVTVACVGDSLTEGLMAANPAAQSYPSVMARLTGGLRAVTENYGHSGACVDPDDSFFQALPYVGTEEYAASVETQAEVVLLMLGTNDAFWSPNRDLFEENFTALLRTYMDLPQAPRVVVVLPPHIFFEMAGQNYNDSLEELLVKERAAAEELGLPVIDAHSFNEGQSDMFVDGIHFTVEGYALLAETIYSQLCEILGK